MVRSVKKVLALIMALLLLVCVAGCSSGDNASNDDQKTNQTTQDKNDNQPEKKDTYMEIYQLAPDKNVLMQCNVIKTPNNKLIVIDGGHIEYNSFIISALRAIKGVKKYEYFEIDAWFLSHAHEDHYGELLKVLRDYSEDSNFKINNFYFDFPDFNSPDYRPNDYNLDEIQMLKDGLNNYARVNGIEVDDYYTYLNGRVVNSEAIEKGLTITIDGVDLKILQTYSMEEDIIVNCNSMVIQAVHNGKKALFLTDITTNSEKRLLRNYSEELQSDLVQLAHHGQNGATKRTYEVINAKYVLWCTPYWVWTNPTTYKIGEVREWFNITEAGGENHLISCLYEYYPESRTSVSAWAKVVEYMKVVL